MTGWAPVARTASPCSGFRCMPETAFPSATKRAARGRPTPPAAPVVLPRSLLRAYLTDGDRELGLRFGGPRLSLVSRVPIAPVWEEALPIVRRDLGLLAVRA